jgi:hypothetical protein
MWLWVSEYRVRAGLEEGSLLRFASEKDQGGTRTLAYVQTHRGFPVWQSGFSVVVQPSPLRVTSSHSTLHLDLETPYDLKGVSLDFLTYLVPSPDALEKTRHQLAYQLKIEPPFLRINAWSPWLYRYDEQRLFRELHNSRPWFRPQESDQGQLQSGRHYLALEILFTARGEQMSDDLSWRAFLELATGSLLGLERLFARATGMVYRVDPLSASGDANLTHGAPLADLNNLRTSVTLSGLSQPQGGSAQELRGSFIALSPQPPNHATPPTDGTGSFDYDATTAEFAAVNAYHHGDAFFQLVDSLGFNTTTYFDGTTFPVAVLHWPTSNVTNALMVGTGTGDGCERFEFGLVDPGTTLGLAVDGRVVAHEFAHAALIDNLHHPTLGFAHSFGDSLAAIYFDPESLAPDPAKTFPWVPHLANREHQRDVRRGWSWGGSHDDGDYESEQILSTTLFRLYHCLGGGAVKRIDRRPAADHVLYLLFRAVGALPRHTVTPTDAAAFAAALMDADIGTQSFRGQPGGAVHKVVRWCFEQQGLYRSANAVATNTPGDPPDVDVYLEDGRGGGYDYTTQTPVTHEAWNRRQPDGQFSNEVPLVGQLNHLYVLVYNRGTQDAASVVVTLYQSRAGSNLNSLQWPHDWQALNTRFVLPVVLPAGCKDVAGPIPWQPLGTDPQALLIRVDADGDSSNIDPQTFLPCSTSTIAVDALIRWDNNLGLLFVTPATA